MKRFACALLALLMTLGCLVPCFTITGLAAGASLSPKKIVSVVYDDSGSMRGYWPYANYALQAFAAMLNEGDELYITYMSEVYQNPQPSAQQIIVSGGSNPSYVSEIRQNAQYVLNMGTPYAAVETAMNTLQSIQDSDPTTQYWFVIMTDGALANYNLAGEQLGGVSQHELGEQLSSFAQCKMYNGTTPEITFLGIGSGANLPKFSSAQPPNVSVKTATEDTIIQVISEIADAVSGRSRFTSVEQKDEKTLEVTTDYPLLNLSIFTQNTPAKLTAIRGEKNMSLQIARNTSVYHEAPDSSKEISSYYYHQDAYDKLNGCAFLVNNGENTIPAGTYRIEFDKPITPSDVVIMFEPALELRATVALNGTELSDASLLGETAFVGSTIDVNCKIFEMGTDKEIKPSKLKDTVFSVEIFENGQSVRKENGLTLEGYTLTGKETRIIASMKIGDFNPITWSTVFTPVTVKYSLESYIDPDNCRLHVDDVRGNTSVQAIFTVFATGNDGKTAVTDPAKVKALNPVITVDPDGNAGTVSYGADGTIIFTPNETNVTTESGAQTITVTCTMEDQIASVQYHVLTSDFYCVVTPADSPIRKNEFYNNEKGVSFQLFEDKTRDGVQNGTQLSLTPGSYTVTWEDQPNKNYELRVTQDADGTIRCTPYSTVDSRGPRWGWLFNGFYYIGLYGKDVTIVLDHQYARASVTIPVIGARFLSYLLPHVIAPTLLLFIVVGLILAYIIRYITKPRFAKGAVVYVGDITRSAAEQRLNSLDEYELFRENKFKNLWNPFKPLTVNIGGLVFEAAGTRIKCTSADWYSRELVPINNKISTNHPSTVQSELYRTGRPLPVRSIPVPAEIAETTRSKITPDSSVYYYIPDEHITENGQRVMKTGTVFCYFIQRQD